jgi:hypothetical protein
MFGRTLQKEVTLCMRPAWQSAIDGSGVSLRRMWGQATGSSEVGKMSAYLIGHIAVKNADKWDEYRQKVPTTLAPWGGKLVFRGHRGQYWPVNMVTLTR